MTIAIVAVLIALLMPTLSSARGTSRDVLCRGNQRQLMTAWHAFLNEHDHIIPWTFRPATPAGAPPERSLHWAEALRRILPDSPPLVTGHEQSVGACPSLQATYGRVAYPAVRWGYAINHAWTPGSGLTNEWQRWEELRRPSRYPWFLDPDLAPLGATFSASTRAPNDSFGAPNWGVGFWHGNRTANVAFADGSASPVEQAEAARRQPGSDDPWLENR